MELKKRPIIEQFVLMGNTKLGWPGDWMLAREWISIWQLTDFLQRHRSIGYDFLERNAEGKEAPR
jgi:hypothetical protein